jgi:hypothetical protein
MTQMIQQKIDQLASEKVFIKQGYSAVDQKNDVIKSQINGLYQDLKEEKDEIENLFERKEQEIEDLDKK